MMAELCGRSGAFSSSSPYTRLRRRASQAGVAAARVRARANALEDALEVVELPLKAPQSDAALLDELGCPTQLGRQPLAGKKTRKPLVERVVRVQQRCLRGDGNAHGAAGGREQGGEQAVAAAVYQCCRMRRGSSSQRSSCRKWRYWLCVSRAMHWWRRVSCCCEGRFLMLIMRDRSCLFLAHSRTASPRRLRGAPRKRAPRGLAHLACRAPTLRRAPCR